MNARSNNGQPPGREVAACGADLERMLDVLGDYREALGSVPEVRPGALQRKELSAKFANWEIPATEVQQKELFSRRQL